MNDRKHKLKKYFKQGLIVVTAITTAIVIIVWSIAPSIVDKRFNSVNDRQTLQSINQEVETLHQSLTIADLHADSLLWGRDLSQRVDYGHIDLPRMLDGNIALQIFASVTKVPEPLLLENNSSNTDSITKLAILQRWPFSTWFSLTQRAIYHSSQLHKLAKQSPETFTIIKTKQDLQDYLVERKKKNITAGLLSIEGAHAFEGKIENIDRLYNAGYRIIGLSHFFDNEVSDSAHGINQGGLTSFGKKALERMKQLNLIIDLAHASSQTIDEVLQKTDLPVLVSHTGVKGTCAGVRNLSDRQLQQIAQRKGIIGIGFWKTAICGDDVDSIVRAIRYVTDLIGIDYVALGSDFDGAVKVPFDIANMNQLTQALQQNNFTESEIRKIMGDNAIAFFQQHLPT